MKKKIKSFNEGRASGILLHPTSLPGGYGIGDLGYSACRFVDFLQISGQSLWQVLPLGPTGYGDSPYASLSSFAGNPLLISPDLLFERGYLTEKDLADNPSFPEKRVDFSNLIPWKKQLLNRAAERFLDSASLQKDAEYKTFKENAREWLPDFALFMALKEYHDNKAIEEKASSSQWNRYWDAEIALRDPEAMAFWQSRLSERVEIHKVLQFFFFRQWNRLRKYANEKGIRVIGDIPIFVAEDSADVWANREQFLLDKKGNPVSVAGVPPDYFSLTGQLWGNPLYNWRKMEEDGFSWWIKRIKHLLTLVDLLRIDHFRGFVASWHIPAGSKTAEKGKWVKSPGKELFSAVKEALGGKLPIIAEDLGVITPAVVKLKDDFSLPGMKVLQFAFELDKKGVPNSANLFLPHNFNDNCVVYTGTHDNDTTLGWYTSLSPEMKDLVRRYFARDDREVVWEMIRSACGSVADLAIIPLQDILLLGSEARMNIPSTGEGNWAWRFSWDELPPWVHCKLKDMASLYGRLPAEPGPPVSSL